MLVVALVVVQYAPSLLGGGVYHSDDAANSYYPSHEMTRRALLEGTLPLWEPGSWSGWPAVVDPYHGIYYPLNVLFYVGGSARMLGPVVALHVLIAAAGLFAFLRLRGLRRESASVGALAFALSSFMVVRVDHVVFIQLAAWMPWLFYAVERWFQQRNAGSIWLLAAVGGLALLSGGLSLGIIAALPLGGYGVARLIRSSIEAAPEDRLRHSSIDVLAVGGAAALAVALAAAQLWPSLAHLPESPRGLGTAYSFASSYAWPDWRYAATLVWPDLFGNVSRGGYVGEFNYTELCGFYVGITVFMLAPFAAFWRAPAGPRIDLLVLAIAALVGFAAAFGDAGPVHPWLFSYMPLYASLRCPARALFILVMVIPMLAAHGVEALAHGSERRWIRMALAVAVTIVPVAIAAALWPGLSSLGGPVLETATRGGWRLLIVALTSGGVLIVASARPPSGTRVAGFAVALAACVAGDLVIQSRGYLPVEPATFPAGTERYQAVEWIRTNANGWRFVNDGRGPFRLHNVGMTYGIENASGYDSVAVWRYVNFLQVVNHGRPYQGRPVRDDLASAAVLNLDSPLLDLLNIRYVITPGRLEGPRYRLVFEPAAGASPPWVDAKWDARLRVYENLRVMPRAFVVYNTHLVRNDREASYAIAEPDFEPRRTVVVDTPVSQIRESAPGDAPPMTPATVRAEGRHALVVDAVADRPGVLVIAEVYYPGWRASVDGQPAPILRADYALRGVALSAGTHRVELRYRNSAALGGLGLSALGALVMCGFGLWVRRRAAKL